MNSRGVTLIELLVGIVITLLILGAIYQTYINLFKGFKVSSETAESQIETDIALEIMRIDIEHAGYGIGANELKLPIEWDSTNSSLTLRSVLNLTRELYSPWILVKCDSSSCSVVLNPDNVDVYNSNFVFINADSENFTVNGNIASLNSAASPGSYIGVMYEDLPNGCSSQVCYEITYELTNDTLPTCHPSTRNLKRKVDNGPGVSVLHCVSDFKVTFDIDTNGDGVIDSYNALFEDLDSDGNGVDRNEVFYQIKKVNVYILAHEGTKDRNFSFTNYTSCSTDVSAKCVSIGNQELKLPLSDFENYRWRTIKLSVKPMNLGGK
ncbi:prepilin-type N-terminal cleavage/methylation domain-containing protein [Hydrogenivirga sp. 128-5-R1-1]|uniref:PilW family protein n=1 Tax=Hydrogenivirga sp. 128-5-R1-1 TaxID=392423 RepID=UPI00015F30C7|nr:prepilin-type N-terminal cleavage/methylation domain-containing protein [Hydrogenivirga sp. 128-5-R1-1]EDP74486.1 hypothetical protein HG1285_09966 [Hydrogenivirga sp. 128-5-R1-1]